MSDSTGGDRYLVPDYDITGIRLENIEACRMRA